jgi:hypothetical protein
VFKSFGKISNIAVAEWYFSIVWYIANVFQRACRLTFLFTFLPAIDNKKLHRCKVYFIIALICNTLMRRVLLICLFSICMFSFTMHLFVTFTHFNCFYCCWCLKLFVYFRSELLIRYVFFNFFLPFCDLYVAF